ncbi:MAG: ABC transporter ATP-binding protein [Candidatus Woykebacteria bacterium RBG_19FT_COMBO_43_10]|uniref:ABC transporter ATP-binding protein n=1 Tax=Candidatus Woykebacteria bacterium RBG_19FT_COMBO_43_10 TaxID=1802598 RepID=A0A1G1WIT7_9BACT|nr:MAG: ABC transporter ATP-binding protein [Candidatus Woykebacteria bacterium RBG_19FT_COMBO_43_10]
MPNPLIELKNVTKTYHTGTVYYNALDDISVTIGENEFVAVMGPSGSGKSTLLNIVAGIDRPTNGQIVVGGTALSTLKSSGLATYRKTQVGIIFQSFNLLNHFTALENVNLSLILQGADSNEHKEKAAEALKWIGLGERLNNKPTQLSGGEQQRVAIVRALVKNPKIILADEPTGNLDSKTGQQIVELIKSLKSQGKTIILVTHNQEIARASDRIIQMKDGCIIP